MRLSLNKLDEILELLNGNELDLGRVDWIEPACIVVLQTIKENIGLNFSRNTIFGNNVKGYLDAIFNSQCQTNKTYAPIEHVNTRNNIDVLSNNIASTIIKREYFSSDDGYEDFISYLKYVLTEVMNNVADHSESSIGGYVTAQYYPSRNTVQIAIADAGKGFLNKLALKFGNEVTTELQAINKAVQKEVTGSLPDMYGAEKNAGYGLYVISKIVESTGGKLIIISNNTMVTFNNGNVEDKKLDTNWMGSIVVFEINQQYISDTLMDFMEDRIYTEGIEEYF